VREREALQEWQDIRNLNLRVSGFSWPPTPQLLHQIFAPYGTLLKTTVKKTARGNMTAYVTLKGSALRSYRACKSISTKAWQDEELPSQVNFSNANEKDVTAINDLLSSYVRHREVAAAAAQAPATTSYMLHVGWLLEPVTRRQVFDFFRPYGSAQLVKVMLNKGMGAGQPRTFAIVSLKTTSREAAVNACVELTGTMLGGNLVEVSAVKKSRKNKSSKRGALGEEVISASFSVLWLCMPGTLSCK
jgi:hypothetical protein